MTEGQASDFGWVVAQPLVGFVLFVAVVLLGIAILREITR